MKKEKRKRIEVDLSLEEWEELQRLVHIHKNGTPEEQEVADKELAKFALKYKDSRVS